MDRTALGIALVFVIIDLFVIAIQEHLRQEKQAKQDELNEAFVVQIAGVQQRVTRIETVKEAKGDGDFPVFIYHVKGRG